MTFGSEETLCNALRLALSYWVDTSTENDADVFGKALKTAIEVANLFFESNDSANDIRDRMVEVLQALGYDMDDVHVYLSEDRDAAE